jgi:uncharacterized membrane protein
MIVTRKAFREAVYAVLILSVVGLWLVCLPIVGSEQTVKFATSWWRQIAAGYAAMILAIEVAGIPLRSELTKFWMGSLFAVALFIVGVFAGSATSMVIYQDYDPFSYIVVPVFWLVMLGLIPALVIGLIGVTVLRYTNKTIGEQAVPPDGP